MSKTPEQLSAARVSTEIESDLKNIFGAVLIVALSGMLTWGGWQGLSVTMTIKSSVVSAYVTAFDADAEALKMPKALRSKIKQLYNFTDKVCFAVSFQPRNLKF